MEILPSARKHDIADDDMLHAAEHSIAWIELGDDPIRFLLAGPDRAGNQLELVMMVTEEGEFMIHAMPMRRSTAEQLPVVCRSNGLGPLGRPSYRLTGIPPTAARRLVAGPKDVSQGSLSPRNTVASTCWSLEGIPPWPTLTVVLRYWSRTRTLP